MRDFGGLCSTLFPLEGYIENVLRFSIDNSKSVDKRGEIVENNTFVEWNIWYIYNGCWAFNSNIAIFILEVWFLLSIRRKTMYIY